MIYFLWCIIFTDDMLLTERYALITMARGDGTRNIFRFNILHLPAGSFILFVGHYGRAEGIDELWPGGHQ